MSIPIYIICHNNYKYVQNTVRQIRVLNPALEQAIHLIDNGSTEYRTLHYLKNSGYPVLRMDNVRPKFLIHHLWDRTSRPFCITDPDLEFHPDLPSDFIQRLLDISNQFAQYKVGFALKIDDFEEAMYHDNYGDMPHPMTIYTWEKRFWESPMEHEEYELYGAEIDTTFCLINPAYEMKALNIRVGGPFTARHLPWYTQNPILNAHDLYTMYSGTKYSTTSSIILRHLHKDFLVIPKNTESILISRRMMDPNLSFWQQVYPGWEPDTFHIFDRYLNVEKDFLDIGGWIGTTCIYASFKSSHVYVVEADRSSVQDLCFHCNHNATNIIIIDRAIFSRDGAQVGFGANQYLKGARENDSTSQIHQDGDGDYMVDTVSVEGLARFGVDFSRLSLIKVDIEGGEEHILADLHRMRETYNVPLYVSFHYNWWRDPDLDRFPFLTLEQKESIRSNPFVSILFAPIS